VQNESASFGWPLILKVSTRLLLADFAVPNPAIVAACASRLPTLHRFCATALHERKGVPKESSSTLCCASIGGAMDAATALRVVISIFLVDRLAWPKPTRTAQRFKHHAETRDA